MKPRYKRITISLVVVVAACASILPWAWPRLGSASPAGDLNAQAIGRIQPAERADDVVFAVMGDSRGGQQVFQRILSELAVERPRFAIHMGDFVTDGKASEYAEFVQLLQGCPVPVPTVIGNHEIKGGGRTRCDDIFGESYYSFAVGPCLFVVVDDADTKDIGHEQMRWLETQLGRDFRHKFVFLHVPPFDPRASEAEADTDDQPEHCLDSIDSAGQFMWIVRNYHVDIVFASHIHGYFDVVRDGVRYIISGGAGAKLHGRDQAKYFHHYLLVKVHGKEVRVDVRRISGNRPEAAPLRPGGLDGQVSLPTTEQATNGRRD